MYYLLRKYVPAFIVIILFIIAIYLLSSSLYVKSGPGLFERVTFTVTSSVLHLAKRVEHRFTNAINKYLYLVRAQEENENLKRRISLLKSQNKRLKVLTLENQRLRRLLEFKKELPEKIITATIIGKDPFPFFKTLIINRGQIDGISSGLVVLTPDGVVGRTMEVYKHHSKAIILTDNNSAIDAIIQRTRTSGVLEGTGDFNVCSLNFIDRIADVKVGDVVITSGMGGVFIKGLPIGEVIHVRQEKAGLFKEVHVKPYADLKNLEEVFIIIKDTLLSPMTDSE